MAKLSKTTFVCQNCGAASPRWQGKCPSCGEWNTLTEETDAIAPPGTGLSRRGSGRAIVLEGLKGSKEEAPRFSTGIGELDRVTGGGIVPGSALLIGGEPGIGKSTLLLQLAATLARRGRRAVYFSGEEAAAQVRLRAERLGLSDAPVALACETGLAHILATLEAGPPPDLIVVDSIQTLWAEAIEAAPGTVSQVRAAAQALIRHAKTAGSALLLVGHVTKDGQIAGPKVIEHMVDTVLYFEGDRGHTYRILRAVKNRFGATDEIGVFEMASEGLREVANPSELFLGDRDASSPGAAVFAGIEGTRPLLVEIQALVAPSSLGTPRRAVVGWDSSRLSMLLAVLEARAGLSFAGQDVYLNVAGGLRINEPAADLAAAAALVSSLSGVAIPRHRVHFGEVSLSGAINATPLMGPRLKEAQKLGFRQASASERHQLPGRHGRQARS
jgi:DNA repair protein RadA/Sms